MKNLLVKLLAVTLTFVLVLAPTSVANAQVVESNQITLTNVNTPDEQLIVPDGATIEVVGNNTIGGIEGAGDLTIVGTAGSSLTVANTTHEAAYTLGCIGIGAVGKLTISNLNLTDISSGTAIADVSGTRAKHILIQNSNITIKDTGDRFYGIEAHDELTIKSSTVNIGKGYDYYAIICQKLNLSDSHVAASRDGLHTIFSSEGLNLDRGQVMESGVATQYGGVAEFPLPNRAWTAVDAVADVTFGTILPYNLSVTGGHAQYSEGYAGETIQLIADEIEGMRFVEWVASPELDLDTTSPYTSFTMPAKDVSIEAVFEEVKIEEPEVEEEVESDDSSDTPDAEIMSQNELEVHDSDTVEISNIFERSIRASVSTLKAAPAVKSTSSTYTTNFKPSKSIKKVIVGKEVKKIKANAFKGCKNLKTIEIKGNVTISKNAFKGINKNATIKVKANAKTFKKIKAAIKKSGVAKSVKIVRVK